MLQRAKKMNIKITDNSNKILEELDSAVLKALTTVGLMAVNYAKTSCPVDTGRLRASICYALSGESPSISSYTDDSGEQGGEYQEAFI